MRKRLAIFVAVLIWVFLAGFGAKEPVSQAGQSLEGTQSLVVARSFGKMPLYFIPNQGQMDARVAYYLQGKDKTIYFTSEGLTYVLSERSAGEEIAGKTASVKERLLINPAERELRSRRDQRPFAVKLDFLGANADVRPSGEEKTGTVISYFKGKPEGWKAGLPTYSRIVYKNLWPGIDVAFYGTVDKMKYEFVVHPGSDPSLIRLAYRGASAVEVNGEGRLEVRTPAGGFADDHPVGYQEIDGDSVDVAMKYLLEELSVIKPGPDGEETVANSYVYGFEVGEYDRTKPLVLDPAVLVHCGYVGGSDSDKSTCIAVDGSGNSYITGSSRSSEATFPVSVGPDLTYDGNADAFVAKVNDSGTALVYCGYIGGSEYDCAYGIAVNGWGNAYITGETCSTEASFPVIEGPDLTHNGENDAFVAKVDASGTALAYCGYIGGADYDYAYGIALNGAGGALVVGETNSTEATFPVIEGPDLTHNGENDAFVAKVNLSGTALVYCGYIGGSDEETGRDIAVGSSGNAYVTGYTRSTQVTFPASVGPDLTHNGIADAFVAKVNLSGTAFDYCGYIGGSANDYGAGIAVDGSENAYVTGEAYSTEATFPASVGPDLTHNGGLNDAFVAKVNSSGTTLLYCGYIGGSANDYGTGIAVDGSGNAHIAGYTYSSEATFPASVGPDLTHNGEKDVFVAKVNAAGTTLLYGGYIGGSDHDYAWGIALDSWENAYVTGYTYSTETTFPVIGGPDLTYNGGDYDAFVAKISPVTRDDLLGTWDGSGVWYRNSLTGSWVSLTSAATLIASGDTDGDNRDDLIGVWSNGLWVRYSKTTDWTRLSTNLPTTIASGDMSGDGRDDIVGSWSSGVWYRNSASGAWVLISSSPASVVAAGDIDEDNKDDLIGLWTNGLWVKNSSSGTWTKISANLPTDIASGDMNGDGRDDVVGTWSSGVWYRNSAKGLWVLMSSAAATLVATGDIDDDSTDDLIGAWATGYWVKKSSTGAWMKISSSLPRDIDAGLFRTGEAADVVGFAEPVLVNTDAPGIKGGYQDFSNEGPGGWNFRFERQENLIPFETHPKIVLGPGDPGLQFEIQENLVPKKDIERGQEKN